MFKSLQKASRHAVALNKAHTIARTTAVLTQNQVLNFSATISNAKFQNVSQSSEYEVDRSKFEFSRQIPDFNAQNANIDQNIEITEEMAKHKHPLEYMAHQQRVTENPFSRMKKNSMLLTNFPSDLKISKQFIRDLCMKADSSAVIDKIVIQEAMKGDSKDSAKERAAYAIVEFQNDKYVPQVRRGLRKHWIQDKLLKVRTLDDKRTEKFADRTIIVQDIPSFAKGSDLVNVFSKFGAVTSIELPTIDSLIQAQLEKEGKVDHFVKQSQKQQEEEFRFGQMALQDTLEFDMQFEKVIQDRWGKEEGQEIVKQQQGAQTEFTKFNMLDEERIAGFVRVMGQLQAEGIQVENSKATLNVLMKEMDNKGSSTQAPEISQESFEQHHQLIDTKQSQIKAALSYLVSNKEALDDTQTKFLRLFEKEEQTVKWDPIHKLQRMSMAELTRSYDFLLGILISREKLIKQRIKESLKHFGKEERILQGSSDIRNEQESLPDIFRNILSYDQHALDHVLGINEQIENVQLMKDLPPEEKMYQWFTDTANYTQEKNFNELQLAYANTEQMHSQRELLFPNSFQSKSSILYDGKPANPFREKYFEKIQEEVRKQRAETDTPFDEIYHKERKLVQDVIRAEQSLKKIQESLPNPIAHRLFEPSQIEEDQQFGKLYGDNESQFIKDRRAEERFNQSKKFNNTDTEYSQDYQHSYSQVEKKTVEDMIQSGQINKQEYEIAKQMRKENRHINLGYALVTFSNADEAKQSLAFTQGDFYVDASHLQVMAKGNLDHSELDKSYFLRKMSNDSKIVDQAQDLREAKKNLRAFERNIDNEMPSLQKLKEFKSIAQEMIENPKGKTRRHQSNRRTEREKEELYQKLKAFQQENPHIDVTSLFESEDTEKARILMHKRAFESYKKFEFLKAGITDKNTPKPQPESEKYSNVFEPYNYPLLKDSVATVLIDGFQPRISDAGDNSYINSSTMKRRGRRFSNYTEQEFLEAYLGKDYTRRVDLSTDEYNHTFSTQGSLKEMFPDKNEFLKYPKMKQDQEKLRQFMGMRMQDGEALDPKFREYLENMDINKFQEQFLSDSKHPTKEGRTMLGDLSKMIRNLKENMEKNNTNEFKTKDVYKMLNQLDKEYPQFMENNDPEGEIFEAFLDKQEEQLEDFNSRNEIPLEDLDQESMENQMQATLQAKFAKQLEGQMQDGETAEDFVNEVFSEDMRFGQMDDQDFEDKSMFNPIPDGSEEGEAQLETEGQSQNQNEAKDNDMPTTFIQGSPLMNRYSNENLNNLRYALKRNDIDVTTKDIKNFQKIADSMTKQRRENFDQLKKQQMEKPIQEQTPHYIDKNGQVKPYSQKYLQQRRKEIITQLPPKSKNLTEQQIKENIQYRLSHAQSQIEIDELEEQIERGETIEKVNRKNPDLGLIDILKFNSNEAIKEVTTEEVMGYLKDQINFSESSSQNNEHMFRYQQTKLDEDDLARHSFRTEKQSSGRTLQDFIEGSEEPDIYEQLKQKSIDSKKKSFNDEMRQKYAEEKLKNEKLHSIYKEADENLVEPPTFQNFFEKQAKGQSSYNKHSEVQFEQNEEDKELERIEQDQLEESQYKKELMARIFGGSLSARQYGVLMNISDNQDEQEKIRKAQEYKTKQESKDIIRNSEEITESYRRNKVHTKQWNEEESYQKLQDMLNELQELYPTQSKFDKASKEANKQYENQLQMRVPNQIQDREYYFDEGLGQSLNDHIGSLKDEFPDVQISTRRDKDGLPIVKMSIATKFKYNLDDIVSRDPIELKKIQMETQEAILKEFVSDKPQNMLSHLGLSASKKPIDYIDLDRKDKIDHLMNQRFYGKYKDDLEGFMVQLKKVKNQKNKGEPVLAEGDYSQNTFTPEGKYTVSDIAHSEFESDRKRFDYEIQYQLMLKVNEKMNFQKLEKKDFVKPTRSENVLYRNQVESLSDSIRIMEKDNEWLLNAGGKAQPEEDYDVEKYKQLKSEIKRQREAKEKILNQGFPELQPYIRL